MRSALVFALLLFVACTGEDPVLGAGDTQGDGGSPGPTPGNDGGQNTGDAGQDSGLVCSAPLADCKGAGVCDTNLSNDPKHCGACNHDCGNGASCLDSACQPVVLAKNLTNVASVAVNATALVILAEGGPYVCPKDGCGGSTGVSLISQERYPVAPHTTFIDGTNAYWLGTQSPNGSQWELRKCALTGCGLAPTTIDDGQLGSEMRGDGGSILRYDPTGLVTRIYTDGVTAKAYYNNLTVSESLHFALAGGKVAFSNTDSGTGTNAGAWGGAFTNTAATHLMNKGNWVAIAGDDVFASRTVDASYDAIYRCPFSGCGGVGSVFGNTGAATGTGKIADMTADASGVYWVEAIGGTGRVMRCSLPDCAGGPKAMAVLQEKPFAITTDDKFVYWVNAGASVTNGSVNRVAK